MKKLIILLAAAMAFAGCSPLRIAMDSRTEEGARIVYTTDKGLFNHIDVALGAKISGKDTTLAVIVTCDRHSDHGIFDKNDRMLIRLSDQSVITLNNIYHKEYETQTNTNVTRERVDSYGLAYAYDPFFPGVYLTPYEVSTFIPRTTVTTSTYSYALYFITAKQLNDIIRKGVIKLRIEIEDSEVEMASPSSASSVFASLKDCLYERISTPLVRKAF